MDRSYLRTAFRIMLHIDDIAILYQIQTFLGVGTVNSSGNRAYYVVQNTTDLAKVVLPLLDTYSLHTVKGLDYLDFKSVIQYLANSSSRLEGARLL